MLVGADKLVIDALRTTESVKQVCIVYRVYDIIPTVEAETMEKLQEIIESRCGNNPPMARSTIPHSPRLGPMMNMPTSSTNNDGRYQHVPTQS